ARLAVGAIATSRLTRAGQRLSPSDAASTSERKDEAQRAPGAQRISAASALSAPRSWLELVRDVWNCQACPCPSTRPVARSRARAKGQGHGHETARESARTLR